MKRRGAIVIGVNGGGGLPPLESAASTALDVAQWFMNSEVGYDVTLLNDAGLSLDGPNTEPSDVTVDQVVSAVHGFVTQPARYELLLVYYCGHGIYENRKDTWLLNRAPTVAHEAINVTASADMALDSGIPTVVFVSDACRSSTADYNLGHLSDINVFPLHPARPTINSQVDNIRATLKSSAAFEILIDGRKRPLLSYALRRAYQYPDPEMTIEVPTPNGPRMVVPNRKLRNFLQKTIDDAIDDADVDVRQIVNVSIPSDDDIFLAHVDNAGALLPVNELPNEADSSAINTPSGIQVKGLPETTINSEIEEKVEDLFGQFFEDTQMDSVDAVGQEPGLILGHIEAYSDRRPLPKITGSDISDFATHWISRNVLGEGQDPNQKLDRIMDLLSPKRVNLPGHFESECGLTLIGGRIKHVAMKAAAGTAELLNPGNSTNEAALVRCYITGSAAEIAVSLEDGRTLLLPLLRGYLGHGEIDETGLNSLSYVPADTHYRWWDYEAKRNQIDRLRAAATVAMRNGRFSVGSLAEAEALGDAIRIGKALDPILGLFAAWSYAESGHRNKINSVRDYMRSDLEVDLFDLRMLSQRRPSADDMAWDLASTCPMLTQGWAILISRGILLNPILAKGEAHLTSSLFTTFGPGFEDQLFNYIENGA